MGYHRAGFEVVGVDIKPQPRYPFTFIQADAMTFPLDGYDVIHASPPCQRYSSATANPEKHPDLYKPVQTRLRTSGVPWIIENVIGAPCNHRIMLCGSMFDLMQDGEWIQRHRNFETSWLMFQIQCRHPIGRSPILVTGHCFIKEIRNIKKHSRQGPFDLCQRLMGIDWMTRYELTQAIPPAYTEFIGKQLIATLEADR